MMPEALDSLAPAERQQVYVMLWLKVAASRDGNIEVRGVINDGLGERREDGEVLCESGVASPSTTSLTVATASYLPRSSSFWVGLRSPAATSASSVWVVGSSAMVVSS